MDLLQRGCEAVVQVVELTESKTKSDLAKVEEVAGTLCISTTPAAE